MVPALIGVLLRRRLGRFAATGDLGAALLQICLAETERDAVRFLLPKRWGEEAAAHSVQNLAFFTNAIPRRR